MVEEKYIALINQEIDGVNSPQEAANLKAYLAADAEAQQLYDELVAAARLLKAVKAVEPPPDLKSGILRAIQPDRHAARAKKPVLGGIKSLVEVFWSSPSRQLRYAYVFAFGLIAGLGIFALLSNTSQQASDNANLYGTLAWRDNSGFAAVDSIAIDLALGRAAVRVKSSPQQVIAEVSLNTVKEVKVQLEFDANDLGFSGVSQANSLAGSAFSSNEQALKFINRGDNRYVIAFANKTPVASLLRFKLFAANVLQHETALATARTK